MQFVKAERRKAKLRLALSGVSGSGKTYGALLLAKGIGGRIAVIDTERGSASLYAGVAGMPEFDVLDLGEPFTPERYISAMQAAERGGYDVLIIDSITHEWNGPGGYIELRERIASTKFKGNTWSASSDTLPRHRAFVDSLLQSPMHIIATMRQKSETAQVEEGGRKKVAKIGMKDEQREDIEYEFTIKLEISHDGHIATTSKDRTGLFSDPFQITEAIGAQLVEYLNSGSGDAVTRPAAAANAVAHPGVHKPTDGAWEALDASTREQLISAAMDVMAIMDENRDTDAVKYIDDMALEPDEKVAFWTRFDAPSRSRLKAAAKKARNPAPTATEVT